MRHTRSTRILSTGATKVAALEVRLDAPRVGLTRWPFLQSGPSPDAVHVPGAS
jgi:hypothetical protein